MLGASLPLTWADDAAVGLVVGADVDQVLCIDANGANADEAWRQPHARRAGVWGLGGAWAVGVQKGKGK